MKNIYATKINKNTTFAKKEALIANGLDEKNPYVHSLDENEEKLTQKIILLHEGNTSNVPTSIKLDILNTRARIARQRQAKFILREISKLVNKEEEMEKLINQNTPLTGDAFRNLCGNFAYAKNSRGQNVLNEDALNTIFMQSTELEMDISPEEYEEDSKLINYNEQQNSNPIFNNEEAFKDVVESLSFDKKSIDKAIENIQKSKDPEKKLVEEFNNLLEKRASKIPEEERSEKAIVDKAKKLYMILGTYYKEKFSFDVNETLNNYITNKDNKFRDLVILNSTEKASSRIALKNSETVSFENVIANIKHLEYIHSKRSWFSRLINWFSNTGENSTIQKLKAKLLVGGITKQHIDYSKAHNTKLPSNLMPHTKEEIENALKTTDGIIDDPTADSFANNIKQNNGLNHIEYDNIKKDAETILINASKNVNNNENAEPVKIQDENFQNKVEDSINKKEVIENTDNIKKYAMDYFSDEKNIDDVDLYDDF